MHNSEYPITTREIQIFIAETPSQGDIGHEKDDGLATGALSPRLVPLS